MKKFTRILLYNLLFSGALILATSGCSKKSDNPGITVPVVTTTTVTAITETTAMSGGNVTSNGGATVTNWGICWSLSPNPTIADSKTTGGASTTNFSSSMTGLTGSTLYYVRAFATNSAGTGYGDQKSFTTQQFLHPVFSVTVNMLTIGGVLSFQLFPRCLNDDVKMTKVVITDPSGFSSFDYDLHGNIYVKNQQFALQDPGAAYEVIVGTWQLEFIGTRTVNGENFDVTQSVHV